MKHEKPFTALPNAVLMDKKLNNNAKVVYWAINTFAYGKRTACWPSETTIATLCGISISSVYRAVRALSEHGYLKVVHRGKQQSNVYEILPVRSPSSDQSFVTDHNEERPVTIDTSDQSLLTEEVLQIEESDKCLDTNVSKRIGSATIKSDCCSASEHSEGTNVPDFTVPLESSFSTEEATLKDASCLTASMEVDRAFQEKVLESNLPSATCDDLPAKTDAQGLDVPGPSEAVPEYVGHSLMEVFKTEYEEAYGHRYVEEPGDRDAVAQMLGTLKSVCDRNKVRGLIFLDICHSIMREGPDSSNPSFNSHPSIARLAALLDERLYKLAFEQKPQRTGIRSQGVHDIYTYNGD
jgi:hypothetical protein